MIRKFMDEKITKIWHQEKQSFFFTAKFGWFQQKKSGLHQQFSLKMGC